MMESGRREIVLRLALAFIVGRDKAAFAIPAVSEQRIPAAAAGHVKLLRPEETVPAATAA